MTTPISFGTSGHRGIIDHSFTHTHVRAIAQGITTLLQEENASPLTLIIGYDPRLGNDPKRTENSFTKTLVDTLLESGISIQFCDTFTPTPVLSFAIPFYKFNGGIMLTASHNPPDYNGLKFNTKNGAPASALTTKAIEDYGNSYLTNPPLKTEKKGELTVISPLNDFTHHCKNLLTTLFGKAITLSKLSVGIDVKHGACTPAWTKLLAAYDIQNYKILNDTPRSDFGNTNPNPIEKELHLLKQWVIQNQAALGIGNDPDGDRHAILDELGQWVSPEEVTIIIAEFLTQKGHKITGIATTCASSQLVYTWCFKNNINYYETSVGFKHFTPYLENAKQNNQLVLAVESSGGFSLSTHTLEKCGFIPGLLLLAIISETKTSLSQLKINILKKYGQFIFHEESLTISPEKKVKITEFLKNPEFKTLKKTYPNLKTISTIDGLKVVLENSQWVLVRASGTEPLLRLYSESLSKLDCLDLTQSFQRMLDEI